MACKICAGKNDAVAPLDSLSNVAILKGEQEGSYHNEEIKYKNKLCLWLNRGNNIVAATQFNVTQRESR
jgi:hypothetical protein